jgi:uncharacterized membrane protein YphA (DoxX/SURF4 family)
MHPTYFNQRGSRDAASGCRAKDLFRIGFGVIWLIDAVFKWQSGFAHGFRDMINSAGQGQPSWLHWFYTFTHNVFTPHPYVWAYAIASLETLIGLALVLGFARKTTYMVTALTGLGIWAVAEGFGGPYDSASTDIGAAVMYTVVALGLLALNYEAGRSRFSVDYLVEQRIPWWHRVAEVEGRRRKRTPTTQPTAPIGQGHRAQQLQLRRLRLSRSAQQRHVERRRAMAHATNIDRVPNPRAIGSLAESALSLRFALPDDDRALTQLAMLESSEPLVRPVLVAEVGGEVYAAFSLADGAVIADPFRSTASLVELLRARGKQLGGTDRARLLRARRSGRRSFPRFLPFRLAHLKVRA